MWFWWIWTLGLLGWGLWTLRLLPWKSFFSIVFPIAFLRLAIFPTQRHEFIGHEAEYIKVFEGLLPTLGDTTFYPAVQIIWWLLGKVSFGLLSPLFWASLIGAASLWFWSQAIHLYLPKIAAGKILLLGLVLSLHWLWSLSAYNVMLPFLCLCIAMWQIQKQQFWNIVPWMGLACALRMEMLLMWLLPLLWSFKDQKWQVVIVGAVISIISVGGMLNHPIPGDGDWSWQNNWWLWQYYDALLLWGIVGLFAQHENKQIQIGLWLVVALNHGLMSAFNDFSARHVLVSMIPLGFLVAPLLKNGVLWLGLSILSIFQLWMYRAIWYVQPEDFSAFLTEHYGDLPKMSLQEAQMRSCARVVEIEPFAQGIPLSHFNLWEPSEEMTLREQYSCIDWCYTLEDWTWSSLGVRNRAIRLQGMYEITAVGIVWSSNAQCLLFSVNKRLR